MCAHTLTLYTHTHTQTNTHTLSLHTHTHTNKHTRTDANPRDAQECCRQKDQNRRSWGSRQGNDIFVAGSKMKSATKTPLFFSIHLYVTTEEPCLQQKSPFNHQKCHVEDRAVFPLWVVRWYGVSGECYAPSPRCHLKKTRPFFFVGLLYFKCISQDSWPLFRGSRRGCDMTCLLNVTVFFFKN